MTQTSQRHIVISGQEYELPYSKGLMASRIMATGLAPPRAYHVAEVVEDRLAGGQRSAVAAGELNALVAVVLREEVGDHYATAFSRWQTVLQLDIPVVVLVGGSAGVGKSTLATMLANRLGITRVIPTDAIREVMRAMFSQDLLPSLHGSSFDVARLLPQRLSHDADPVIVGFRDQASTVAVALEALISRAMHEGTDLIVEGVHILPGFLDGTRFKGRAVIVPVVISVEDEELHRAHFVVRAEEVRNRPSERYLDSFGNIRKLQRHLTELALEHGVPVVSSQDLDATLSQVIDLVVSQAFDAIPHSQDPQSSLPESKRGAP